MHQTASALWPFPARAAIFDFDGTLADTASLWKQVNITFLTRRGLAYTPDYPERLATLGFVNGAAYTIERFGLDETVQDICDEWNDLGRELYQTGVTLREGAERYIRALRELDVPCALATTNDSRVIFSMEHVDARSLFDAWVFGAEVGRGKDCPDIYLEAARRLGAEPRDCLVFEDIVPAVRSAASVGMMTCGVRANDPNQRQDLLRASADLWLDNWLDIPLT